MLVPILYKGYVTNGERYYSPLYGAVHDAYLRTINFGCFLAGTCCVYLDWRKALASQSYGI